ncbi:MAG: queuosine precursor transporter [Bacteroidota bacterium]|nr:queuosine precursor transporter [Bacteroidota bacterium]
MHILKDKKVLVLIILSGFFIANTIVAEMIGSKLISFGGPFVNGVSLVLWPFVFILTDILNEYYGKEVVRRLSFITVGLIAFVFVVLFIAIRIPAVDISPAKDSAFQNVFGQSMFMIVASIIAFVISQLVDSFMFWFIRKRTGEKMLWLRSTGSTFISQLIDTFIVQFIAFVIPGYWSMSEFAKNAAFAYGLKILIALSLIPLIWLLHKVLDNYFGDAEAHRIIEKTAEESLK